MRRRSPVVPLEVVGEACFQCRLPLLNPSIKIPGTATDIAAGADGTVWHINSGAEIYRYTGDQPS